LLLLSIFHFRLSKVHNMTLTHRRNTGRGGYTFVELLVVIAIIAILMGLLVGAAIKVFSGGDKVRVRDELGQLSSDLVIFMQDRKIDIPPPSMLLLREDGDYSAATNGANAALARDSHLFLIKMFGNISFANMDWNGNGVIDAGFVILDGPQCLVFFLGGIKGNLGFSTNTRNPTDNRQDRIGPFFKFQPKRLTTDPSGFPRYNDPWGTPYAYFSSYNRRNGYEKYYASPGLGTDCPGLVPYYKSTIGNVVLAAYDPTQVNHYNPETFQIISAGPDKQFGAGGLWGPGNPALGAGADDYANFHRTRLGTP